MIHDCLYAGEEATRRLARQRRSVQNLEGGQFIDDVILVDQSTIGRNATSNGDVHQGYDAIREVLEDA